MGTEQSEQTSVFSVKQGLRPFFAEIQKTVKDITIIKPTKEHPKYIINACILIRKKFQQKKISKRHKNSFYKRGYKHVLKV